MSHTAIIQNRQALENLPADWSVLPFSKVVKDASGGNVKLKKEDILSEGDYPVIDQGQQAIAGYHNDPSLVVSTPPPFIVFGDHTRLLKYIDFKFIMGADGVKLLVPALPPEEVYWKYVHYFLLTLRIPNSGYSRHYKYLKDALIPLPPLEEQKRIAAILDAADAHRPKTKELLGKYDELAQSLFLEMFGDPVTNPKGWEVKELGEVLDNIESGWSPKCHSHPVSNSSSWGILKLGAVSYRKYNAKENKQLPSDIAPRARIQVQKGDLLFSRKNTLELVGAVAYVFDSPSNLMFPDTIFRLKCTQEVNKVYLWQLLNNTSFKKKVSALASGSAASMPNISKSKLKDLSIPFPPTELQDVFGERIQALQFQINQISILQEKSEDLFNSLLQKAFRGNLH